MTPTSVRRPGPVAPIANRLYRRLVAGSAAEVASQANLRTKARKSRAWKKCVLYQFPIKIGKKPSRRLTVPCGWAPGNRIRLAAILPLPAGD